MVGVAGCKKVNPNAPASASGQVIYKNEPLTAGSLTIYAGDKGTYTIGIRPDGTFSQKDLPAGDLDVTVETESANPAAAGKAGEYKGGGGKGAPKGKVGMTTSPMPGGGEAAAPAGKYVKIPPKYSKRETSKLKLNLAAGKNDDLRIELKDD